MCIRDSFYDVTEGRITVDGKDIRSLTLKSLRNNIGTVQQDVYLFDGTIPVSYTHLDVYKRQASPSRRNLLSTASVYLAIANAFSPAEYLTSGSLVKRPRCV